MRSVYLVAFLVPAAVTYEYGPWLVDQVQGDDATVIDTEASYHSGQPESRDPVAGRIAELNVRYQCSINGLGEGVVPRRAVVMHGTQVRVTTFDDGWDVYKGRKPGTLVSVCAR